MGFTGESAEEVYQDLLNLNRDQMRSLRLQNPDKFYNRISKLTNEQREILFVKNTGCRHLREALEHYKEVHNTSIEELAKQCPSAFQEWLEVVTQGTISNYEAFSTFPLSKHIAERFGYNIKDGPDTFFSRTKSFLEKIGILSKPYLRNFYEEMDKKQVIREANRQPRSRLRRG